jgi:hypothetical protein
MIGEHFGWETSSKSITQKIRKFLLNLNGIFSSKEARYYVAKTPYCNFRKFAKESYGSYG